VSGGLPIPEAAAAGVEQALNRYLALDPEGAQRLARLHGRVICIEVTGFGTRLYLIPGTKGIQVFGDYAGEPDCVLRGPPLALTRIGVTQRKEDQLFSGQVQVSGDTHLAQEFGRLIGGIEVDWEEQLSRIIGDPAAHEIGSAVRATQRWGDRSADTLAQDVKEYLQEEGRLLPTRYETEAFLDEVDRLRDDVERLAARVDRIAQRLPQTDGEQ
jgi:ubiquinone biosynthesis accessory factor UbiJ